MPRVVCNETSQINRLSGNVRGIVVNYCQQAKKIIETNGLTVSRFNQLTLLQQANPAVKQLIQAELLRKSCLQTAIVAASGLGEI